MIDKLRERQDVAYRKMRMQEDDIHRRNNEARGRLSNTFGYYSPKARTMYSPHR